MSKKSSKTKKFSVGHGISARKFWINELEECEAREMTDVGFITAVRKNIYVLSSLSYWRHKLQHEAKAKKIPYKKYVESIKNDPTPMSIPFPPGADIEEVTKTRNKEFYTRKKTKNQKQEYNSPEDTSLPLVRGGRDDSQFDLYPHVQSAPQLTPEVQIDGLPGASKLIVKKNVELDSQIMETANKIAADIAEKMTKKIIEAVIENLMKLI